MAALCATKHMRLLAHIVVCQESEAETNRGQKRGWTCWTCPWPDDSLFAPVPMFYSFKNSKEKVPDGSLQPTSSSQLPGRSDLYLTLAWAAGWDSNVHFGPIAAKERREDGNEKRGELM